MATVGKGGPNLRKSSWREKARKERKHDRTVRYEKRSGKQIKDFFRRTTEERTPRGGNSIRKKQNVSRPPVQEENHGVERGRS